MRRHGGVALLCLAVILLPQTLLAQDGAWADRGYVAVDMGYVDFLDDFFDPESDGIQLGIQAYVRVHPDVFVGVEAGSSANFTIFLGEDITVSPFELNGKYVRDLGRRAAAGVGAGLSYSRVEHDPTPLFRESSEKQTEWLFGAQVFADVSIRVWRVIGGMRLKYQTTQDFPDASWDARNWRVGPFLGIPF